MKNLHICNIIAGKSEITYGSFSITSLALNMQSWQGRYSRRVAFAYAKQSLKLKKVENARAKFHARQLAAAAKQDYSLKAYMFKKDFMK